MSKYKVGDKFVMEIADVQQHKADNGSEFPLYRIKGFSALTFNDYGLDLMGRLVQGVDTFAYNKGMEDAFQLLKRIATMSMQKFNEIFGGDMLFGDLFKFDSIKKIKEMVDAYDNRLKVGDVLQREGSTCVVTAISETTVTLLWSDGKSTLRTLNDVEDYYEHTGQHIPIKTLLAQMAESQAVND